VARLRAALVRRQRAEVVGGVVQAEGGEAEAAPHACLGVVANGVGQYDKGVEEFEHALARQPDSEAAYLGLAGAYQGLGQNDKAEEPPQLDELPRNGQPRQKGICREVGSGDQAGGRSR